MFSDSLQLRFKIVQPNQLAGDKNTVPLLQNTDAVDRSHFSQNGLNVLIIDGNTLRTIDLLDSVQQIMLDGFQSLHFQKLLRI